MFFSDARGRLAHHHRRHPGPGPRQAHPADRNEISRLLTTMIIGQPGTPNPLHWSARHRRRQHAPGPATTSGKSPPNDERHDPQLEISPQRLLLTDTCSNISIVQAQKTLSSLDFAISTIQWFLVYPR